MLETGRIIDRFTVEALLGEGGMAEVYRVRHTTLGSLHAIKLLKIQSDAIRRRLVMEGQVQASLRHANVVAVTDVIFVDEQPGLVMELVNGPTLETWLQEAKPSLSQAEALFLGIVAGVDKAHRAGLVHRDLKPGNVLLDTSEGTIVPKVTDFGLAKVLTDDDSFSQTRTGVAMGTPQYMAPEQIRSSKDVDQRTDIWALGCILYQLVTGIAPFEAPDIIELYTIIGRGRYPSPTVSTPGLPPRVLRAINGCLTVDREARIADCDALRATLQGSMEPVGSPTSAPRRPGRLGQRRSNPLVAAETPLPMQPFASVPPDAEMDAGVEQPSAPPPAPPDAFGKTTWSEVTATVPPPARPDAHRAIPVLGLALGAGVAVALALAATVLFLIWHQTGDATSPVPDAQPAVAAPTVAAPAASPVVSDAPPVSAPPSTAPVTTAPAALAPVSTPARPPPSAPTPAPSAPVVTAPTPSVGTPNSDVSSAAPKPATAPTGTVRVTGKVQSVVLSANGRSWRPGDVPVGTYNASVTFAGRQPIEVGPLDVMAGHVVTLACDASFVNCVAK